METSAHPHSAHICGFAWLCCCREPPRSPGPRSQAQQAALRSRLGWAPLNLVEYIRPAQVNSNRRYSTVLDGVACGPALAQTCSGQRSEEMCGGVDGGVLRTAQPSVAGSVASNAAFRCMSHVARCCMLHDEAVAPQAVTRHPAAGGPSHACCACGRAEYRTPRSYRLERRRRRPRPSRLGERRQPHARLAVIDQRRRHRPRAAAGEGRHSARPEACAARGGGRCRRLVAERAAAARETNGWLRTRPVSAAGRKPASASPPALPRRPNSDTHTHARTHAGQQRCEGRARRGSRARAWRAQASPAAHSPARRHAVARVGLVRIGIAVPAAAAARIRAVRERASSRARRRRRRAGVGPRCGSMAGCSSRGRRGGVQHVLHCGSTHATGVAVAAAESEPSPGADVGGRGCAESRYSCGPRHTARAQRERARAGGKRSAAHRRAAHGLGRRRAGRHGSCARRVLLHEDLAPRPAKAQRCRPAARPAALPVVPHASRVFSRTNTSAGHTH
jgi:hypothetical protein